MFKSIEEIQQANKDAGYHWFDAGSMAFFDSIVYPTLVQHPQGAYFISSEKQDDRYPRFYTVRFARFTGEANTVGPFQGFTTEADARQHALDHKDNWIREHSEDLS